jgi:hypothetical protein
MDESRCPVSGLEAGVTRVTQKDTCQAVKTSNIVSAVIILNLVALATLGLILAAFHFAGSAAMIVVPFWVVFLLCGYPWSDLGAGSNGSWSGLDVYFEVMLDTPERAAALHEFIERLRNKHTLPPGNGCPQ